MNCPFCGHPDSRVIDSRPDEAGVRRRRECRECNRRFTTLEKIELGGVAVVKKDDSREEFGREKVIAGVRRACEKRPIPSGAIEALADEVEKAVYAQGKAEVPSSYIGELVMERLRGLDHIAYIRFASVYRAFADVEELEQELAAQWRDYLQPIIRALKQSLGAEVSLLGPRMGNPYSSPQYGFVITGHVGFPQGRPADVAERFGDRPVEFRAYVSPDGTLIQPIEIG
ncbi:hypothetical protein LCGC14_2762990 [marine sediment metagenome]|uniref:ATP-cone domain-containing protein n=1 Tax=marine sediment metagenome TaxID=412755 RepID=A0A0F8YYD1_9ZZZZ